MSQKITCVPNVCFNRCAVICQYSCRSEFHSNRGGEIFHTLAMVSNQIESSTKMHKIFEQVTSDKKDLSRWVLPTPASPAMLCHTHTHEDRKSTRLNSSH